MGGLPRRAYVIERLLEENQFPVLLVDSGNILFKKDKKEKLRHQDRVSAKAIQEMYRAMGYTAMAVGPRDLLDGVGGILEGLSSGTPWVSANVFTTDDSPLFPPWIIFEEDGLRIGVIGLTGPANRQHEAFHVVPWRSVLPDIVERLSLSCDFLILLSNMDDDDNRALAAEFPEICLLISANTKKGNMVPTRDNRTLVTQTHTRGKYFGSVTIHPDSPFWEHPPLAENSSTANQPPAQSRRAESEEVPQNEEGFSYRFRSLTSRIPDSPAIREIISELKSNISSNNQQLQSLPSVRHMTNGLVGLSNCVECHKAQWDFWKQTRHAEAYITLVEKDQQYNLDCLPCHVTHQPGGTDGNSSHYLLNLPDDFRSVGCEMCHGSAASHATKSAGENSFPESPEKSCLICHTQDMDPSFSFQEKAVLVSCPSTR